MSLALEEVIDHIRNCSYMSGIQRTQARVKATGEVFTPTPLVQEILEKLPLEQFTDPTKTFLDPSCGDGQFLGEVLIRKMENGSTFEQALSTVYGVDLMIDNVDLCRERLLCGREDLKHIVEQNIYQADALKFSYKFEPMSNTRRARENRERRKTEKNKHMAQLIQQKEEFDKRLDKLFCDNKSIKESKKSKKTLNTAMSA